MRPDIRKIFIAGLAVLAAAGIVFLFVRAANGPDARYREAVRLTETDSCTQASAIFEELGDYRDAKALLSYCRAWLAFDKYDPSTYAETHKYLDEIPAGYSGDCDWEVASLRAGLSLAESPPAPAAQSAADYSDRLPFVGMPTSAVGNTSLGPYSDTESAGDGLTRYNWVSDSGRLYFYAVGSRSAITQAVKYNAGSCWDGDTCYPDGKPSRPSAAQSAAASSGDPFDAESYCTAEDFYYDYPDDFVDYEDAEDYWNAHQ
jgi:hypothetical protein